MLRNVVVNCTMFFYPVGNTPAVCLTQDLPPEVDADILLLGCGDARSVLYTVHADAKPGNRQLDLTCCDIEPAIIGGSSAASSKILLTDLARNILLYTLITDQTTTSRDADIWNIYYHFRLDNAAATLLQDQLGKLCIASESMTTWRRSSYGKYISFSNSRTIQKIHEQWNSWRNLNSPDNSGAKEHDLAVEKAIDKTKQIRKKVLGDTISMTALRSAAPASLEVMKVVPTLSERFWDNGTVHDKSQVTSAFNPTFVSTLNDNLVIHYGTDPLLGYHLATAYAPLISNSDFAPKVLQSHTADTVVQAAQDQFATWASAFRHRYSHGLTLRFIVGDALSVAFSLQQVGSQTERRLWSWYCDSWTLEPLAWDIELAGQAPSKFDIIDTSNLIDHLGPLNILLAAAPLLKNQLSSALYTEVLVQHETKTRDMLDNLLCGDFPTVALLLGLAPVEYLTNASVVSNVDEGMFEAVSKHIDDTSTSEKHEKASQVRSRICWRASMPHGEIDKTTTKLGLTAPDMAQLLYSVYLKMFSQESMMSLMSLMSSLRLKSLDKISNPYYTRASFAVLLCHVKKHITSDWEVVIDELVKAIEDDRSLMLGKNYIQEMYLYFHLFRLRTFPAYSPDFQRFCPPLQTSPLSRWGDLPSVVALTFEVPRERIEIFSKTPAWQLGTPSLCCTLESSRVKKVGLWSNTFAALQIAFGTIQKSNSREEDDYTVSILPDVKTWTGTSKMIVSFRAPTWLVLQEPQDCQLFLSLQPTAHATMKFMETFPLLRIFETVLGSQTVHVTKYMPNLKCHPTILRDTAPNTKVTASSPKAKIKTAIIARLDSAQCKIINLTYRIDLLDQKLKNVLANKSVGVEIFRKGGAHLDVIFGKDKFVHAANFPAPVLAAKSKTRIARESGYVEVIVPLASLTAQDRLSDYMFPNIPIIGVSMYSGKIRTVLNWNVPFINLDKLPILDTSQTSRLRWLIIHTSLMFSSRERKIREGRSSQKDLRTDLKDGLFSMFMHSSGLQGGKARCYALHKENEGGAHLLIFVSALRLDLGNHTVVLDVAVLPLTHDIMRKPLMAQVLGSLQKGHLCIIQVGREELKLWKTNLPAFVERCRNWSHDAKNCEYFKTDTVPLPDGLEDGKTPLCSCGMGRVPEKFMKEPKIPSLNQMLRKYATRAAIAPCFAVPYVEECFEAARDASSDRQKADGVREDTKSRASRCWGCSQEKAENGNLLKCSRCKVASYCSVECQKKDWRSHKANCEILKDVREQRETLKGC